jgi:hypothetical protein
VENDRFRDLALPADTQATNYNFGERGLKSLFVSKQMLLTSTPTMQESLASLSAVNGLASVRLQAGAAGLLSIQTDGGESVQIYNQQMLPVYIGSGRTLTAEVAGGASYTILVGGVAAPLSLHAILSPTSARSSTVAYGTNPLNRFDVDGDSAVTVNDAIAVIKQLRSQHSGNSFAASPTTRYPDVNGDHQLSVGDAIELIARLRQLRSVGQGEGEAAFAEPIAPAIVSAAPADDDSQQKVTSSDANASEDIVFGNWGRREEAQEDELWPSSKKSPWDETA